MQSLGRRGEKAEQSTASSVLTITVPRDPSAGPSNLKALWEIAETSAADTWIKRSDRHEWRLVRSGLNWQEDRQQALDAG